MSDMQSRLKSMTDTKKWTARGATFKAKAIATKEVWFPTGPTQAGKKSASKTKKTAKRATKKATAKTARRAS
jgi:hypothetical protein